MLPVPASSRSIPACAARPLIGRGVLHEGRHLGTETLDVTRLVSQRALAQANSEKENLGRQLQSATAAAEAAAARDPLNSMKAQTMTPVTDT